MDTQHFITSKINETSKADVTDICQEQVLHSCEPFYIWQDAWAEERLVERRLGAQRKGRGFLMFKMGGDLALNTRTLAFNF